MIDCGVTWKDNLPMFGLPKHLGGHYNITHIDEGAIDYLINTFNIKTMYDIGCGPGGMVNLALNKGIKCTGIDGDFTLKFPNFWPIIFHDFTSGGLELDVVDLGWSCEFLEHVEEKYINNYFTVFNKCKFIFCTFSLSDNGYHHVNVKNQDYWNSIFEARGFVLDIDNTLKLRKISTMERNFVRDTGSLYINKALNV